MHVLQSNYCYVGYAFIMLVPRARTAIGQRSFAVNGHEHGTVCQPILEHQIRPSAPSSVISRPTCFSSSLRCCWQVGSAPFVQRRCDCSASSAPFTNIQTYLLTYVQPPPRQICRFYRNCFESRKELALGMIKWTPKTRPLTKYTPRYLHWDDPLQRTTLSKTKIYTICIKAYLQIDYTSLICIMHIRMCQLILTSSQQSLQRADWRGKK